jgi:hypothetical protein
MRVAPVVFEPRAVAVLVDGLVVAREDPLVHGVVRDQARVDDDAAALLGKRADLVDRESDRRVKVGTTLHQSSSFAQAAVGAA